VVQSVKFTEQIPISSHLKELKDRFIIVGGVVLFFLGVCFYFRDFLLEWLQRPIPTQFKDLTFISPTEPFFTAIKVALMGSLFISMPVILFHTWKFLAPGLKVREKKITMLFTISGTLFFMFGGVFCYFLVLPLGLKFLLMFGAAYWKMEVTIGLYYTFTLKLIMAFAFAFQTPLVLVFMTKLGVISTVKMRLYRKWAFMGCFVIAAVLTPPDVITQMLLAIPLYGLYEFGLFVSYFFEDPKNRQEAIDHIMAQKEAKRAAKEQKQKPATKKRKVKKTAS
jgi:sec-independent protein translocase protein TatC